MEKIANVFSWIDYKKTAFIAFLLLILTGIASGQLLRIVLSLFCIQKMVKGKNYYFNKHYLNNRKFGIYCLRYILQKSFP